MYSRSPTVSRTARFATTPHINRDKLGLPTLGLALLITSFYYVLPLGRYSLGGFASDFRIYDFAFVGFAIYIGLGQLSRLETLWKDRSGFHYWAAILLVLVWISLVLTFFSKGSNDLLPGILRAFRFTAYLLTAGFVVTIVDNPRRHRFIVKVIYLNIVVQAGLAAAQRMGWVHNFWPDYWLVAYGEWPVGTLSPHHKHIGVVMLLGIGLSLAFLQMSRSSRGRVLLLSALGTMVAVSIFAGSRTAWLGIGGLVLAYLYIHRGKGIQMLALLAIGLALLYTLTGQWFGDELSESLNTVLFERVNQYGLAGLDYDERTIIYFDYFPKAIQNAPWILITGTGFQNISSFLAATGAHNNYLQAFIELGIIGFLVYLRFLWSILKTLDRAAAASTSSFEKIIAQGVWVAFAAVLVTMLVGESLWAQYSMFTLTGQIMSLVAVATCPLNWQTTPRQEN